MHKKEKHGCPSVLRFHFWVLSMSRNWICWSASMIMPCWSPFAWLYQPCTQLSTVSKNQFHQHNKLYFNYYTLCQTNVTKLWINTGYMIPQVISDNHHKPSGTGIQPSSFQTHSRHWQSKLANLCTVWCSQGVWSVTYGDQTFSSTQPTLWNLLPHCIIII